MITHVVLFKLADRSAEAVRHTCDILAAMDGKISQLVQLEVGENALPSSRAYDIALIARFNSWEDMETYQKHPVHQKVLEHVRQVAASVVAVDYEA